jgi:hypothetical protein
VQHFRPGREAVGAQAPRYNSGFVYFPAQPITEPYLGLTVPALTACCEPARDIPD